MANASYLAGSEATAAARGALNWARAWPWSPYVASAAGFYVFLCSFLRFQRRDAWTSKFNFRDRKSLASMTNVQAQQITRYIAELEFPKIYLVSIQFALFKTYGIPTISKLLVATKQLSTPEFASKRFVDTGVIISEFTANPPTDERAIKALARMNYIHSGYQKSGKITDDDLLYTLSVFITEPISWVNKYEWRQMTDMEVCAISTLWKSIGDGMGIQYAGRLSQTQWKDGIEFYEDIKSWAQRYESRYMVPAATNKKTADELVPLLLFWIPGFLKGFASDVVGVLMGDMLRTAMSYPTPSKHSHLIANAVLTLRKYFLRYLSLPRPSFLRVTQLDRNGPDKNTGRYHLRSYVAYPFYVKPTIMNRWGPEAWLVWAFGRDLPGDKAEMFSPQGYFMSEVGPAGLKNKGEKETREFEEKLFAERPAGCPFAFGR